MQKNMDGGEGEGKILEKCPSRPVQAMFPAMN